MEATVTPAGQAILRIERGELDGLLEALREALMVLETLRQQPMQFEGFDLDRDADQIEQLHAALEQARDAAL